MMLYCLRPYHRVCYRLEEEEMGGRVDVELRNRKKLEKVVKTNVLHLHQTTCYGPKRFLGKLTCQKLSEKCHCIRSIRSIKMRDWGALKESRKEVTTCTQ